MSGFCDTGHNMVESGFSDLLTFAAGVWLGTQKLGNSFSLPFVMFDIADALLLGWSRIEKQQDNNLSCKVTLLLKIKI